MRWFRRLRRGVSNTIYGIRNVVRWVPVIWRDADFDWEYLANVMEYKLRRMNRCFASGHHVGWELDAQRVLICAELLRRLREDEYWVNAQIRFGNSSAAAKHANNTSANDRRYLGLLMGKYLNHWWD